MKSETTKLPTTTTRETANTIEKSSSVCVAIAEQQIQEDNKHNLDDDDESLSKSNNNNNNPSTQLWIHLEKLLSEMKSTHYQFKTDIDENKGIVNCDCSGLMCFLLKKDFPECYASLQEEGKEAPWRKRPLAVTFYETFIKAADDNNHEVKGIWKRIYKMMEVQPGDIVAWRSQTIMKGSSTGHTCMVGGKPTMEDDGRVRIRVIDSTRYLHSNDTRDHQGMTGIGSGVMWFRLNEEGEPIGFFVRENSKQSKPSTKIAIGRII